MLTGGRTTRASWSVARARASTGQARRDGGRRGTAGTATRSGTARMGCRSRRGALGLARRRTRSTARVRSRRAARACACRSGRAYGGARLRIADAISSTRAWTRRDRTGTNGDGDGTASRTDAGRRRHRRPSCRTCLTYERSPNDPNDIRTKWHPTQSIVFHICEHTICCGFHYQDAISPLNKCRCRGSAEGVTVPCLCTACPSSTWTCDRLQRVQRHFEEITSLDCSRKTRAPGPP